MNAVATKTATLGDQFSEWRDRQASLLARGFKDLGETEERAYDLADEALDSVETNKLDLIVGSSAGTHRDAQTGKLVVRLTLFLEVSVGA